MDKIKIWSKIQDQYSGEIYEVYKITGWFIYHCFNNIILKNEINWCKNGIFTKNNF